jgi:hypothetical protein
VRGKQERMGEKEEVKKSQKEKKKQSEEAKSHIHSKPSRGCGLYRLNLIRSHYSIDNKDLFFPF